MIVTLHFALGNDLPGTESYHWMQESNPLMRFDQLKNRIDQNSITAEGTNHERREKAQNDIPRRSSRSPSEIHELLDSLEKIANEAVEKNGIKILPSSRSYSTPSIDKTRIFPYEQTHGAKESTKDEDSGFGEVSPDLRIINGESVRLFSDYDILLCKWG